MPSHAVVHTCINNRTRHVEAKKINKKCEEQEFESKQTSQNVSNLSKSLSQKTKPRIVKKKKKKTLLFHNKDTVCRSKFSIQLNKSRNFCVNYVNDDGEIKIEHGQTAVALWQRRDHLIGPPRRRRLSPHSRNLIFVCLYYFLLFLPPSPSYGG